MDYTESQNIAADPTRDIIVTAGAGTGKTTVLSLRTLRHLENFDTPQISEAVKKIVAITFTNEAANQMRERIFEQVFARFWEATTGKEAQRWFKIYRCIENAQISTIHSLCRTLLTRFPLESEVVPNFSVDNSAVDPAEYVEEFLAKMTTEKSELLLHLLEYATRWEIKNILTAVYENRQYTSESLRQLCNESPDNLANKYTEFIIAHRKRKVNIDLNALQQVADITIKFAQLYAEFEKFVRSGYRAISTLDFNQLVIGGLKLVKQFSEEQMKDIAPEQLMVDEFQDTSPIQWELIEHLARYSGRVMFVGDEKQSIYRFRGADVTVVRSGEEFIGGRAQGTIVSMGENFRTHPRLLNVINRIFKGIFPETSQHDYEARYQELTPGKKWEDSDDAGLYLVPPNSFETQEEAVSGIIKQILAENGKKNGEELGKFMVLTPTKDLMSKVVNQLRREGIPALALTPHGFWSSGEISFFVHLLNFLHEPRNNGDLFFLLTSPVFGVDSETIRHLPSFPPGNGGEQFLWDHIEKAYKAGAISDGALTKGYEKLKQVLDDARDKPVSQIISAFLDDSKTFSILTGSAPEIKIPNLLKLMDIITSYEWAGMNLEQIVEAINPAVEKDETPPAGPINTKNFVRVSTVHSAKGLEAPIVIVLDNSSPQDKSKFFFEKEIPGKFLPKIKRLQEIARILCGGSGSNSVAYNLSKHKRDAENKRLLYVALTRAQERVYFVPIHKNRVRWFPILMDALGIGEDDLKNPSALPDGVRVLALNHIPQRETLFDRKPQKPVAEFLEPIPPNRTEISATVLAEFLLCPQFFAFNTNPPEDIGRFGFSLKKSDAAERGKKIHQLASLVAVYPPEEIFTFAESIIGDPQEAKKIAFLLKKFYDEEVSKCSQTLQTEMPLVFAHGGITISGQADLVCGNTIYDFKTGRKDGFSRALYSIQLDLYRLACAAAKKISPEEIETKIVWLSDDDFEIQTTPHDPEILRKIEDFKDFIQSGKMPAAKTPPLCEDCIYKNNCNLPNSH